MLSVLHDLTLALAADRVLAMQRGRLVADGRPGDPELHRVLADIFDGAVDIQPVPGGRWVAVPAL